MVFPIHIIWMGPFSILGESEFFFFFFSFFIEIPVSKQYSPRWDAAERGVSSGSILFAYVPKIAHQAYTG